MSDPTRPTTGRTTAMFHTGDKVTVIAAGPENSGTEGRTGIVIDDGTKSGGLIAVKGIDSRLIETVKGYRGYTADQLQLTR